MDSAWTKFEVLPAQKNQRAQWLSETSAAMRRDFPSNADELLNYGLPNILGVPDPVSLSLVLDYLYHPDMRVRRYATEAMRYWPETEADRAITDIVNRRGPTDDTARMLAWKPNLSPQDATALARLSMGYLNSDSTVVLQGAIGMIRSLASRPNSPLDLSMRDEALAAVIIAAPHIQENADRQTASDLASLLGDIGNNNAYELLWKMVDRRVGLGAALSAIVKRGDPADLPRLGSVLASSSPADRYGIELYSLPSQLREKYGDAAFPYLEQALEVVHERPDQLRSGADSGRQTGCSRLCITCLTGRESRSGL